ncbi:uncharacterized protein LOC120016440 isoform X1 [Tripterygium wilfordii]|uniref:uncharacterized protein LOC120016440 isoform X1 n=1 Tax=Tripterygium wilfordii TaxID=458696 RepID=UPI0018F83896|nr:uncharacterized protein LOC120016440 isoform X1 [Tripterygium wilfordii]
MDLEIRRFDSVGLSKSFPISANPNFSVEETPEKYGHLQIISESTKEPVVTKKKPGLVELVLRDDKQQLVAESKLIDLTIDQSIVPKLLVLCCAFDSVECAASILHGELGEVPLLNSTDEQGKSPLHAAAEQHSARCVELLLRKRARTDLRTKDGRAQLPLELSLSSWRMEVIWNPDEHSIEDLIVVLGQKDMTAIKLLTAKTKAIDDVAYACAMGGRIVALAALLMVAAKEVNESILVLHDAESGSKEETTVYECVIREALALGCTATSSSVSSLKRNCGRTKYETAEKRKVLLCEMELLQLFGAVARGGLTDKRVASSLILAVQAGDGDIVELLLKTSIDINDADAEGNSALHWCLKSSKASCSPQKRNLWLLLKHGARVSQKNKLGLTALHIAAENGNTEALQILLLEEPDCINYKSEMKETPLFYAVKNDHLVCTELLLLWGAEREVFNLRRQRPIDLAVSQDMRFILSPANIRHMNRVFPVQKNCNALLASDEVISESCEKLISTVVKGTTVDSGCIRGDKCVFAHCEEELQQTMQGEHLIHASAMKQQRKIFVGGLPPSLDSDSLGKLFEESFGSVEDAVVMEDETGKQSRGFGFITFKHEKSVSAAVDSHYVTIGGKQVEIKSAIPKCLLCPELQKRSPGQSARQLEQEQNEQYESHIQTPTEKTATDMPNKKTTNEGASERLSWVDTLLNIDPKTCSNEFETHFSRSSVDKSIPIWLRTFKKWLPLFLEKVSKREGEYALSSVKADFKAECGLELDHASLGYSKLSDFMRSLSDLCHVKYVDTGKRGPSNHMILEPKHPTIHRQPLANCSPPSRTMLIDDNEDCKSSNSKSPQDHVLICDENVEFIGSSIKENLHLEVLKEKSVQKDASPSVPSGFLQFLKPDTVFPANKWLHNKEANLDHHYSHVILEALARRRNKSSFFTREFDFYKCYKENVVQGKCFGCNQRKILWANFPCQHLLWCADCKLQVTSLSGHYEHKCVICDKKVDKIDIVPLYTYHQPICHISSDEFPPLDSDHSRRKKQPVRWVDLPSVLSFCATRS